MENLSQTKSAAPLPKSMDLSPQQLAKEADLRKQKKLIKEKLYPFLEMGCKDLSEVIILIDITKLGIEGAWSQKKNKSTLKSLDIVKGMNDKVENYKKVKFMMDTLEEETVGDSVHILDSLHQIVNTYGSKEISKKPLKELKEYFDNDFKV